MLLKPFPGMFQSFHKVNMRLKTQFVLSFCVLCEIPFNLSGSRGIKMDRMIGFPAYGCNKLGKLEDGSFLSGR
jgi:hypothetical protein